MYVLRFRFKCMLVLFRSRLKCLFVLYGCLRCTLFALSLTVYHRHDHRHHGKALQYLAKINIEHCVHSARAHACMVADASANNAHMCETLCVFISPKFLLAGQLRSLAASPASCSIKSSLGFSSGKLGVHRCTDLELWTFGASCFWTLFYRKINENSGFWDVCVFEMKCV